MRAIKRALRGAVEAQGYYLRQRQTLPYGVDYMLDIKRLSAALSHEIRTFFDVGACWGETSTSALANFPNANVVAFEPTRSSYAKLCGNLSKTKRFSAHNIALGSAAGRVKFYEYEASLYNSMTPSSPTFGSPEPTITEVQCETLDSFCADRSINSIDVLKIDAEKCDLAVLQGAKSLLAQNAIKFIYFEFYSPHDKATSLIEVASFLESFGCHFVACYVDRIDFPFFIVANALFMRP